MQSGNVVRSHRDGLLVSHFVVREGLIELRVGEPEIIQIEACLEGLFSFWDQSTARS
jgi:hypothetical protein